MNPVPLAARERPDLALLPGALEVEPGTVRPRGDGALAERQLVFPAGDLLPHGVVGVQLTALIHVADLHRLAQAERAAIRLLLPDQHAEQRCLAGTVRSDHPDDPS